MLAQLPGDDSRAHQAHMDGIYRYQRYFYDVTRKFYLLGRDRMLEGLQPPAGGTVLEIGCGTGRNLIQAARRYPNATFYGFDISTMMLETARANVAKAGLSDRITLAVGDASAFSSQELFGVAHFDRVFISYAVSMIPPWQAALVQGVNALAPRGSLHVVDFGQQTGYPRWFRTGLHAWLAKFTVEPRANLEAEMAALAAQSNATLSFAHPFGDYAHLGVISKG